MVLAQQFNILLAIMKLWVRIPLDDDLFNVLVIFSQYFVLKQEPVATLIFFEIWMLKSYI